MMKVKFKLIFLLVGLTAILSSCRTSAPPFGLPGIGAGFHLIGRRHQP